MSKIAHFKSSDILDVADLLHASFDDDLGLNFVFRTPNSRRRWLPKLFVASTRLVMNYGVVTGIRMDESSKVSAVAQWFLPSRPFPPPWHRALLTSVPLVPLMFEFSTYVRLDQLNKLYLSLMPRDRRFIYLGGLAVQSEYRNQGLGTRLVQWGQEYAVDEKCALFLHCWAPLVPYYERRGFFSIAECRLRGIESTCHGLIWEPPKFQKRQSENLEVLS